MKNWPAFIIGVALILLTPLFGGGLWFFLPVWWLTFNTLGKNKLPAVWFGLGLVAELVSPNPAGVSLLEWTLFLTLLNLWLRHFTGSDLLASRMLLGVVSAGFWTAVTGARTFFLLDQARADFFIFLPVRWLIYSLSWCGFLIIIELARHYVFRRPNARFS